MPPWKPGESGNPDGYTKGKRNRSTVAREIANTVLTVPDKAYAKLTELYPDMPKKQQVETLMMWQQALKAIAERDTKAFMAIMDCLYGKPSQGIELSGPDGAAIPQEIKIKSVKAKNDKST